MNLLHNTWDVVIAGSGPGGAALACMLAREGRRVAIVDAATFPRHKVCGEFMSPAGWSLVERLGAAQQVSAAPVLDRLRLVFSDRRGVEFPFGEQRIGEPRCVSRYELDLALVEAAQRAGTYVLMGHRVHRVMHEQGVATGLVVAPVDEPSHEQLLTAPVVIGADGRGSVVVRDTGVVRRSGPSLLGFKRHLRLPLGDEGLRPTISMHALPGGYMGMSPVSADSINLCGVIPASRVRAARGDFATALEPWIARLPSLSKLIARAEPLSPWKTVADVSRRSAEPRVAGVLYIGDACGTIEPVTGQGMTMAMEAAQLAADVLAAHDGQITPTTQAAYLRAWLDAFAPTIRAAAWLGRLLARPRLLDALVAAAGTGVATRLARMAYRLTILPAPGSPALGRGSPSCHRGAIAGSLSQTTEKRAEAG